MPRRLLLRLRLRLRLLLLLLLLLQRLGAGERVGCRLDLVGADRKLALEIAQRKQLRVDRCVEPIDNGIAAGKGLAWNGMRRGLRRVATAELAPPR